jgi:hypothetical protein
MQQVHTNNDNNNHSKNNNVINTINNAQQVHKWLLPSKSGGLHDRVSCALYQDAENDMERATQFLGLSISKTNWQHGSTMTSFWRARSITAVTRS